MNATRQLLRFGQRRLVRKMVRAVPYLGGVVAVLTLGSALRRKGVVGGAIHTALDMIPFVGGAKNAAEVVRGRDFFPDRDAAALQVRGSRFNGSTGARSNR